MADCLPSPVKDIGKCIWDSFLKPHVDYWWCFEDNIQQLKDGIRDLEGKISDLKARIDAARLRVEVVRPGVEEWLNASTDKLEEARKILLPNDNIPEAWKLISRYSLGKNAKETAEEIAKRLNNGKFDMIADPAPPPAMASPPHRSTTDFGSRKGIEEDIIKSLKESSVAMIGICGMGGIGKTTMAQRIRKRVKDENLFDEVAMVTVSQKIDMLKIQEEIAEWLKLKFDDKYLSTRAATLRTRLMDPTKKLIILDDVWESLKLDYLGVPFECERCKILLTTRSKDVCKKMEAQKIIAMEILTEEEAWILFKDKTGDCVEDLTLKSMAKDVVAECKCLPLALVTVGLALRDNRNIRKWKDSLSQLKKSNPSGFPEVLMDVYKPLKLSYDCLDNNSERHLFLLCCLFPEDFNISVEQLTWYGMGLGLFDDNHNIEEARNRTHTLVEKLESRFLLIDVEKYGKKGLEVKMHDVLRDVAIYIGSKEKKGFLKSLTSIKNSSDVNCNWMSVDISNERMEVPVLSQFPKLHLLLLSYNNFDNDDISNISFEGTKDLNVLTFERISIRSLPPTLGLLKNLRTLCLFHCEVETISVIVELTSLKIFSCRRCRNITELPEEIRRLKDLRLLELTGCRKLQRIPFGVISSLRRLEELKMRRSFSRWEAEENGKERRNASLKELECLRNLSCLEIEIDDCTLSAQEIRLSQNLVKYYIRIGSYNIFLSYYKVRDYEKVMILNLPSDIGAVGKWIQKLVRNTELLHLEGDGSGSGSNNFNIAEIEYLRNLRVWKCSTVKKLDMVFCSLETLILEELENLEEICIIPNQNVSLCNLKSIQIINCHKLRSLFSDEGTEENTNGCLKDVSFGNLKSINILECHKLRSLFSVSVAKTSLLQLEYLGVSFCDAMEQVFWNEGTYVGCIEFPKLKKLALENLPNLTAFCQGLENNIIKFPNLTQMKIGALPKLNSLCPLNSETLVVHDQNTSFHFVCNPKVELGCLKKLSLYASRHNSRNIWCHQIPNNFFNNLMTLNICFVNEIRSLMSTSIAKSFVNLKYLWIFYCDDLVEVIERDENDNKQLVDINCLFPTLKQLTMESLPKLKKFWQWNPALELPLLEEVCFDNCPVMETFTLGSINTPNIRVIKVNHKEVSDSKDLNDIIHHVWTESQDKSKANVDKDGNGNRNENENENKD